MSVDDEPDRRSAWLEHPNPLVRWGGRAWLLLGLLLVGWALWHVAGILRLVIVPLVIALFPAGVLMPVVDWLERHRWPRGAAALAGTAVFVIGVVGLLTLLGWQIGRELSGLAEQVSTAWGDLRSGLGDPSWLPERLDPSALMQSASESGAGGEGDGGGSNGSNGGNGGGNGGLGSVVVLGRSLLELGAQFFLGIVALFFYLRDRGTIAGFLVGLFPPRLREHARVVEGRTWQAVTQYIRGQSIVALVDGVLFAVGLMILGVPLAWVLGAIVALGAYVPVVGSIVAGAVGVGVALVSGGLTTGLLALALIVGVQQLEGNVIAPYVLGRELHVHPLVVVVSVTAGAAVLGPFGALIGVPAAAALHQAAGYLRAEVADGEV